MDDAIRFADGLGPQKLVHIWRPAIGLRAVVAIDNIACGPSIGGVRMAPDVSTEEAFRLARAMTLKNAAAGLAHGGGKSVVFADPRVPAADKERLIRAFARSRSSRLPRRRFRALPAAAIRPRLPGTSTPTASRSSTKLRSKGYAGTSGSTRWSSPIATCRTRQ
ncbi:MAG TPA: Glu/Leu/Phe/Val dehydrogenase dimerization domain-containing protein [Stellaceae bacterium]|nr:Glu/Leu/Phe/Val dehydrogenase dimerization domain-containing protein [Stellaceae bacterium]